MATRRGQQASGEPISVDLSKAIAMEPLPVPGPYLCMCTKMAPGTSGSGGRKVDFEAQVTEPETVGIKNRKFFDSINLDNEYTLGRLQMVLKAFGISEDELKNPNFQLSGENFVGMPICIWAGLRHDETGQYSDRNTIARVGNEAAYRAAVEAQTAAAPAP